MDEEDVVHIYNGILLSHKKEWNNAICSNMDGLRDDHTKWSQSKTNVIWYHLYVESKILHRGFPGGAVVENLPANAGDAGLSPGPGRSHMPRSNKACAPQLLSLRSRAREPQLLSPHTTATEARVPRAHALQRKKPPQWEAQAPQRRVAPARRN